MAFPHPEAKPTGWAFPPYRPQPMIATIGSGCERSEPSPLEQPPSDGIPTRSTTSRRNGQLFPLTENPPSNHPLCGNHPIAKAGEPSVQTVLGSHPQMRASLALNPDHRLRLGMGTVVSAEGAPIPIPQTPPTNHRRKPRSIILAPLE